MENDLLGYVKISSFPDLLENDKNVYSIITKEKFLFGGPIRKCVTDICSRVFVFITGLSFFSYA